MHLLPSPSSTADCPCCHLRPSPTTRHREPPSFPRPRNLLPTPVTVARREESQPPPVTQGLLLRPGVAAFARCHGSSREPPPSPVPVAHRLRLSPWLATGSCRILPSPTAVRWIQSFPTGTRLTSCSSSTTATI